MKDIKILDCTLRDGGYVNNWQFGAKNIVDIIQYLDSANFDYIECGFLTESKRNNNQTLFNSLSQIEEYITHKINASKLCAMIAYGDFSSDKIPLANNSLIKNIRLIFKKHQQDEALNYCQMLLDKGYNLFVHPTFLSHYNDKEIEIITKKISRISPFAMSIVDSIGAFREKQLVRILQIINQNLESDISLCFHTHDSLGLSFSNTKTFIANCLNHDLIIDSTINGIGRGAGNLPSEVIC